MQWLVLLQGRECAFLAAALGRESCRAVSCFSSQTWHHGKAGKLFMWKNELKTLWPKSYLLEESILLLLLGSEIPCCRGTNVMCCVPVEGEHPALGAHGGHPGVQPRGHPGGHPLPCTLPPTWPPLTLPAAGRGSQQWQGTLVQCPPGNVGGSC